MTPLWSIFSLHLAVLLHQHETSNYQKNENHQAFNQKNLFITHKRKPKQSFRKNI